MTSAPEVPHDNDAALDPTEFRDRASFEGSVTALREGFADLEAGRTTSLEEVPARGKVGAEERRRGREAGLGVASH